MTKCIVVDSDAEGLEQAASLIAGGGLAVIPGHTNYAFVVDGLNRDAIQRLYAVKGRMYAKPLALMVPPHDVERYVVLAERARSILCLMGDPIAVVARARPDAAVRQFVNPGGGTLGVFWLHCFVHRYLYHLARHPIAGTSLNRAGEPMIRGFSDAIETFGEEVDLIVDGGDCPLMSETSTVVDVSEMPARILRPGAIGPDVLQRFIRITGRELWTPGSTE